MKIAMFSTEMSPFIKTGGLGDVLGSLPYSLTPKIDQIDIFLPYSREIKNKNLEVTNLPFKRKIKIGTENFGLNILKLSKPNFKVNIYFINNYHLFGIRSQLYVKNGKDYRDNLKRFVFFSKGALKAAIFLSKEKKYNIFHLHDWQTALIALYIKNDPFFNKNNRPLTVYTIHNLAYQGKFPAYQFNLLGIDKSFFHKEVLEFFGKINLMKAGIIYSDVITTVSRTYAEEIQTEELGYGLGNLLKKKRKKLFGIQNGVDYNIWNPKIDPLISANYSSEDLSGKAVCKADLQKYFKLDIDPSIPILCVISRLTWQKGMELVLEVIPKFLKKNIQFILLGNGDPILEQRFSKLSAEFPNVTGIRISFNDHLAHQIEAGSDIFLMPSRYEPCGLNDKYSLKYGTIPIARKTGGLADSIIDYTNNPKQGTGFLFEDFIPKQFEDAIERALKIFQLKSEWLELMKRGMQQDFSWQNSAEEYLKLYKTQFLLGDNNG